MLPSDTIVKAGVWLYDGTIPAGVRIVRRDTFYGTGDHEDPPEIRDDQDVTTFAVWFDPAPQAGIFNAGGGQYRSLVEAIAAVEQAVGATLTWQDH